MAHEKEEQLFDTRIIERNIVKGLMTREEYKKYLKSLKDEKQYQEAEVEEEK